MLFKEYKNPNYMKAFRIAFVCFTVFSIQSVLSQSGEGQQDSPADKVAPKYSNEFLAIGIGADALGLANSVVAQTSSVNSGYWNPAGLAKVKGFEIGMSSQDWVAGISHSSFAAAFNSRSS